MFFLGGLDESVDQTILHAAFIPFGEIVEVLIPQDVNTRIYFNCFFSNCANWSQNELIKLDRVTLSVTAEKHKGFGFVEFESPEDAAAALDNMHNSELFGRTIKCNLAKPQAAASRNKPVWEDEEFMKDATGAGADGAAADAAAATESAAPAATTGKKRAREAVCLSYLCVCTLSIARGRCVYVCLTLSICRYRVSSAHHWKEEERARLCVFPYLFLCNFC